MFLRFARVCSCLLVLVACKPDAPAPTVPVASTSAPAASSQAAPTVKRPSLRVSAVEVNGKKDVMNPDYPVEVIQRSVRKSPSIQTCYEEGLKTQPELAGTVEVKFVITKEGRVTNVTDAGSKLADPKTLECVMHAFPALTFNNPDAKLLAVALRLALSLEEPKDAN